MCVKNNQTALEFAAEEGSTELVKSLVESRAGLNLKVRKIIYLTII